VAQTFDIRPRVPPAAELKSRIERFAAVLRFSRIQSASLPSSLSTISASLSASDFTEDFYFNEVMAAEPVPEAAQIAGDLTYSPPAIPRSRPVNPAEMLNQSFVKMPSSNDRHRTCQSMRSDLRHLAPIGGIGRIGYAAVSHRSALRRRGAVARLAGPEGTLSGQALARLLGSSIIRVLR
jgi:hypothetical protein